MNTRELSISLLWLAPMIGAGLLSVVEPAGGLVWGLAVAATVLSGANVALHLDLVAP